MNKIDQIYDPIIQKLHDSGFESIIIDLERVSAGAATSSEALMLMGKYLFDLRKLNSPAYELIKELIREYLNYCKENGLIIR
jgi:hypothetical protein